MKNRICFAIAGVAMSATLMAVAAPAHAEDRRPCVSKVEFNSGFGPTVYTRRELEERWDVRGLGRRADAAFDIDALVGGKTFTIDYPRCAFSMDVAYYSATYLEKTKEVVGVNNHRVHGTPPHGHM